MRITEEESHTISVLAGQGDIKKIRTVVETLAQREDAMPADVLMACKDDFQQTAAHIAAKSGQARSIETLADLLHDNEKKAQYFNAANRFSGDRPVHTAMRHGFVDVFKTLVRHGADPTAKNRFGDTAVDYPGDFDPSEVHRIMSEYVESTLSNTP
ncbi:hypothetical protein QBC46DRAFT_318418 [Diplogelasinospora grovesii]|uniref:Ankyrin repeat protein n=1 Tax=Diplogelasinospora grovesii TaxID=303347 RepID=A0AAN6S2G5_9PEZI|nr:hypothetical protein QBC46DRAFT_318418 [Diplogelasinospora grovesii]